MAIEKAILAAGCFWGVEAYFKRLKGVVNTEVGYCGGTKENPTYKEVCTGNTGHAESVLIEFDNEIITYEEILEHFWKIHDPTSLNRQGADIGTQYRSAIFYLNKEQKEKALKSKKEQEESGKYKFSIVTKIEPAGKFWCAEEYHQDYLDKNPNGYCHIDLSLLDKF